MGTSSCHRNFATSGPRRGEKNISKLALGVLTSEKKKLYIRTHIHTLISIKQGARVAQVPRGLRCPASLLTVRKIVSLISLSFDFPFARPRGGKCRDFWFYYDLMSYLCRGHQTQLTNFGCPVIKPLPEEALPTSVRDAPSFFVCVCYLCSFLPYFSSCTGSWFGLFQNVILLFELDFLWIVPWSHQSCSIFISMQTGFRFCSW